MTPKRHSLHVSSSQMCFSNIVHPAFFYQNLEFLRQSLSRAKKQRILVMKWNECHDNAPVNIFLSLH